MAVENLNKIEERQSFADDENGKGPWKTAAPFLLPRGTVAASSFSILSFYPAGFKFVPNTRLLFQFKPKRMVLRIRSKFSFCRI